MTMSIKALRERWRDDQLRAVEKQLVEASRNPKAVMPSSPFGVTENGLADFRGARLHEPVKHLLGVRRVDFSHVVFDKGASVSRSELEDCVLDGVVIQGVFVGRRFERCCFVGAKLQQARINGVFVDCDFSRANLSGSVASGARFERCNFTKARLGSVLWVERCIFEHCVFEDLASSISGSVEGSVFIGTASEFTDKCITDHVRYEDGATPGGLK